VDITTVAVANGRYFGGGMCVAPTAEIGDGIFDVTLWSGYTLSDFILKSKSIYNGTHTQLPGTQVRRCRTLLARSNTEVLMDVDGEQPGQLPCTISMIPSALMLKG
jgi:diacylglycerol kinase family enzyme